MPLNEQGIPSLRDLCLGWVTSLKEPKNRHLALAAKRLGLQDHYLRITLEEYPIDPDEEEDWEEEEGEDEDLPDPKYTVQFTGLEIGMSTFGEDDEDEDDDDLFAEDPCEGYPKECEECEECFCTGPEEMPVDHELELSFRVEDLGSNSLRKTVPVNEYHPLMDDPAFIRFFNQLSATHGV